MESERNEREIGERLYFENVSKFVGIPKQIFWNLAEKEIKESWRVSKDSPKQKETDKRNWKTNMFWSPKEFQRKMAAAYHLKFQVGIFDGRYDGHLSRSHRFILSVPSIIPNQKNPEKLESSIEFSKTLSFEWLLENQTRFKRILQMPWRTDENYTSLKIA